MPINLANLAKSIGREITKDNTMINNFIKEMEAKLKMDTKEYTIDRFEGDIAVCEDRENNKMINIKKENLPQGAKEGSVLKYENGKYSLDKEKEEEISKRIKEKMDNLWNN